MRQSFLSRISKRTRLRLLGAYALLWACTFVVAVVWCWRQTT